MRTDGRPVNTFQRWSTVLGFTIIVLVQVAGFAYLQPAKTAEPGLQVLCTGIIANVTNPARDDELVVHSCAGVGVYRADFGPTRTP